MDTTETTSCLEWCAGYGGISLGLKRAIPSLRTIAFGEIEGFACANLVAKMEAGLLDAAPIWTDIKTFPCESFRDRVDIFVAGYPCQPFSAAGKRLGTEDPRHLWPYIARAISVIRPRLCFFENVEGHISLGLSTVISDLEELGYKVSWGIFSASEVGAPHQRKRVFILAHRSDSGLQGREWFRQTRAQGESSGYASECGGAMADSILRGMSGSRNELGDIGEAGQGRTHLEANGHIAWPSRPGERQYAWEPPRVVGGLAHTGSLGWRGRSDGDEGRLRGEIQTAGSCGCSAEAMGNAAQLFSDGCDDHARSGERSEEISKSGDASWEAMGNAECLCISTAREYGTMDEASGIPTDREGCESAQTDSVAGASRKREGDGGNAAECCETQPALGRDANGPAGGLGYAELCVSCDNPTDELRLLGNGVVPATAERAFRVLIEEINK